MSRQARVLDCWSEVANIGAGHAANALSVMTGHSVWMSPPRVERAIDPLAPGWDCGAFFSLDGPPSGELAVLLPDAKAVAAVLDLSIGAADAELLRSALAELGNILVSHAASAMAEVVGGVSLPSPPQPALERALDVLRVALAQRPARGPLRICSELYDEEGRVHALLIFVPDAPLERGLPRAARTT